MRAMISRDVLPLLVLLLAASLATPVRAQGPGEEETLMMYAEDTWDSFVAMTYPTSGLPDDNLTAGGERGGYTSPTNIGAYIWSTLAARDLGIITAQEAESRIGRTLTTVNALERHEDSGQFYNWYDPQTGVKLLTWPPSGDTVCPFLSTVDNGWLAAALIMVTNSIPELADEAAAIESTMNFGFYYDPDAGLLRGGYWPAPQPEDCPEGFTGHHYGTLNTEPRISSYIGIARGDLPPEHYYRMWRTFPATCDWSWHEMQPGGEMHTYMGVEVFQGHYFYRGMRLVPSWGGSMFEALMVNLLVPEAEWGPQSWGVNHPLYVRAQIEHGLEEAQYGYWGFSPSNNPSGGYREYGVDAIGMNPDGYSSNNDHTLVDYGFGDCPGREPQPIPPPEAYTNGVVTPHASFLALEFAPAAALLNLHNLSEDFGAYSPLGFYDAINVDTGEMAENYLSLDQGMIMAALANRLTGGTFRNYFADEIEEHVRPLLEAEVFTAGETPTAITVAAFEQAGGSLLAPLGLVAITLVAGLAVTTRRRRGAGIDK
jgi:hypothetical protein